MCDAVIGWRLRTPYMKAESDDLDYQPTPNINVGITDLPIWQPPNLGVVPPP
jgi:hypothetical protein